MSNLMSEVASDYHSNGLNCPFDCASCPGNIEAERWEMLLDEAFHFTGTEIENAEYWHDRAWHEASFNIGEQPPF